MPVIAEGWDSVIRPVGKSPMIGGDIFKQKRAQVTQFLGISLTFAFSPIIQKFYLIVNTVS